MVALRAFQIIKKDGVYALSSTYNVINSAGEPVKQNAKDSFYAVDEELEQHIKAIEDYIMTHRLAGE